MCSGLARFGDQLSPLETKKSQNRKTKHIRTLTIDTLVNWSGFNFFELSLVFSSFLQYSGIWKLRKFFRKVTIKNQINFFFRNMHTHFESQKFPSFTVEKKTQSATVLVAVTTSQLWCYLYFGLFSVDVSISNETGPKREHHDAPPPPCAFTVGNVKRRKALLYIGMLLTGLTVNYVI